MKMTHNPFLKYVAEDIYRQYGRQMAKVTIVFPNKRAALFLNEYLVEMAGLPLWPPTYTTISDIFRDNSTLQVADDIKLICELYKSYVACTGSDEPLDRFYGWGTVLLADFNDIDKSMADAEGVLSNLKDIHAYDSADYLNEQQVKTLQTFFQHFSDDHNSRLKEKFYHFWSHFHDIYTDFNQRLAQQGLAYEGALYRAVITENTLQLHSDQYIFVGFNALQKVEQKLFQIIKSEGKAKFYWDFDHYYTHNTTGKAFEAGEFVRQWKTLFPNTFDSDDEQIYDCFRKDKTITFIGAPTDNMQARYVSKWLQDEERVKAGHHTAIVLCNENLLPTVIHCIPESVSQLNITTGFPLMQSTAATFIGRLMQLQYFGRTGNDRYRLKYVSAVLRHPYAKYISPQTAELHRQLTADHKNFPKRDELTLDEGLALLFQDLDAMTTNTDSAAPADRNLIINTWLMNLLKRIAIEAQNTMTGEEHFFQESIYQTYLLLNRLKGLMEAGDLQVDFITYQRLLHQLIASAKIPYHGEPAVGLQIMGVLETRNLDFEHLLILSCNEGNMPKGVNDSSFIPYSLKEAFGLTTPDHQVSIYAYYFYRLLQRATDITIMYGNVADEKHTGEMSRLMLQLLVESDFHIERKTIISGQLPTVKEFLPIEKTPEVMKRLKALDYVSPTAINRFIRCQLQFFYNIVAGIKEPDPEDDEIDGRIFGNIFHDASQYVYEIIMGVTDKNQYKAIEENGFQIEKRHIEQVLKDPSVLERAIDMAFAKHLFKTGLHTERLEYNGLQLINRKVILHYLRQLFEIDLQTAPFIIRGLERDVYDHLHIITSEGERDVKIGGRIDRLDEVAMPDGSRRIRVIDYKTGSRSVKPMPNVEAVFDAQNLSKHSDYFLQAMLYAMIVSKATKINPQSLAVSPELLFIQHVKAKDYNPILVIGDQPIKDIKDYVPTYEQLLKEVITHIMEPQLPFTPTEDRTLCAKCPYHPLCGKNKI